MPKQELADNEAFKNIYKKIKKAFWRNQCLRYGMIT